MSSSLPLTWDLAKLYTNDLDPRIETDAKAWEEATAEFANKWRERTDYLTSVAAAAEALSEYDNWAANFGSEANPAYYFWLRTKLDQSDPEIKARFSKFDLLSRNLMNKVLFFELNLGKISEAQQKIFLDAPELSQYRHFLETLFTQAKYQLSEGEEKVASLLNSPAYSKWIDMVAELISTETAKVEKVDGTTVEVTFSELMELISDVHKITRDNAAAELNKILAKHVNVAEHELNSVAQYKQLMDQLRGLPYPAASRHISDDMDAETVNTLRDAVSANFQIAQDYYAFKAKLLGVDKLAYHERNVPIVYTKQEPNYTYEEAVALVNKALNNLDSEFVEIFDKFAQQGHIDVLPNKGKYTGAFCAYGISSQPIYILLNFTNKLNDVTTLAHEVGHGINDELVRQNQNALHFGTPLSTAEVASTFMEDFVLDLLWQDADPELKLQLMLNKLNDEISTIFRQIACYMFEEELHNTVREKGYLSKTEIGELFLKHMAAYMGEAVEQNEGSQNWWVYWSHIRRFFYNYSYANGLLISKALQSMVRKDGSQITKVKEFLSTGRADSPRNIFAKMNIDITQKTFWEQGLAEIKGLLDEAQTLAKELGKI
jgi:oligoendopeptidase F